MRAPDDIVSRASHMPKYDVPWMRSKFTDHLIRVSNETRPR